MADFLTVKVVGLAKIKLGRFAVIMANHREPFTQAVRWLKIRLWADARKGKKPGGGTYTGYSGGYKKWLAKRGLLSGKKWLWLSGKMMKDMQTHVGRTRAQVGYWGYGKSVMMANVHHKGSSKRNIPARPWIAWRKGYVEHIENNIMWPWIAKEARKAGVDFKMGL